MTQKTKNKHYLYSELKEMYLRGTLRGPDTKGLWMIFHKDKAAQDLGDKGLTYVTWEDFVDMIKLEKK